MEVTELVDFPEEVRKVIDTYFSLLETTVPNLLEGLFLFGSISIGAFKYGFSDLDFIAVLKRKVTQPELRALKDLHTEMQQRFPKVILDGMYVLKDDAEDISGTESLRFNEGKFYGYRTFDTNSIDAYQLKEYGIAIKGNQIECLNYVVEWEVLINNMRDNLNSYWVNWLHDCQRFLSMKYIGLFFSLRLVEWGVLGVTRLFYTFKERDIISKAGAGEYALKTVPERWHKVLNESMRLRNGHKKSLYNSVFERRKDAIDYLAFMIDECNRLFK